MEDVVRDFQTIAPDALSPFARGKTRRPLVAELIVKIKCSSAGNAIAEQSGDLHGSFIIAVADVFKGVSGRIFRPFPVQATALLRGADMRRGMQQTGSHFCAATC
ncbi:MAG: hypothetical protein WCA85_32440 [Paraburkholderia sp.]|uniref:hypothetical protein n=1 Tax=Paraburkholderia sp. TaxID=1926495 RepID=UPI003C5CE677